jgi:hypothetical protein
MFSRVSAWGAVVAGAVLAAGLTLPGVADAAPKPPACPSCGHNLILNPGADAAKGTSTDTVVKVPHWKGTHGFTAATYAWGKTGGGDLSPTSPGPKNRGANYFYGGPESAVSTGTQLISVAAGGVSSGKVHWRLAGWLGGFSSQDDHAVLDVTFENAKGKALATYGIGPVTEAQRGGVSKLILRFRSGIVPAATRDLKVELIMTRDDGSDNDGLADSLSLVFTEPK